MEVITVLVSLMILVKGTAEAVTNIGTVAGAWSLQNPAFYKTLAGALLFVVSLIGLLDLIPI